MSLLKSVEPRFRRAVALELRAFVKFVTQLLNHVQKFSFRNRAAYDCPTN